MYERSAIVLERYFHNLFGYFSQNNLKVNFENYCSLVEKLEKYEQSYEQELTAIQEFEYITEKLQTIQKTQEKLYKKSAKLEYNRNILFNNIEDDPENIEHCMLKIENDVDKVVENFKHLRTDFISALNEYSEKSSFLAKSKKSKKEAEKLFKKILEETQENIDNINEFALEVARNFNEAETKEKLLKLMLDNGKSEKIPFDEDVITLAIELGIDIEKKEVQCYIDAYDSILKIFFEIEREEIKIEKYKRKLRNAKVILNFLAAEKEYLVQFLDYERMMSISGKRMHKKLMEQACENFKVDVAQIRNLYELIEREITNKSTQKIYKELYNKSYLLQMSREEESLKKEKNKVDSAVATVLGSNYWRIEGIKNIYTVFYKDISKVFGRYLDEFDVPKDEEIESVESKQTVREEVIQEVPKYKAENIEIAEEVSEEELPQLFTEEEVEPEIENFVEKIVTKVSKIEEPKIDLFKMIDELDDHYEEEPVKEIKSTRISKIKEVEPTKKSIEIEEAKVEEPKKVVNTRKSVEPKVSMEETISVDPVKIRKTRVEKIKEEIQEKKSGITFEIDEEKELEKLAEEIKALKQESKKVDKKAEKLDDISIIEPVKERKTRKEKIKEENENVSIIEPVKERKSRRDRIKEEEENKKIEKAKIKEMKKEQAKIKEESRKKKKEEVEIIEAEEVVENISAIEPVKERKSRKERIKEEEENKKKVSKVKEEPKEKKKKIQIIEEVESEDIEEETIKFEKIEEELIEENVSNIEEIEEISEDELYGEEESLFGNIKNTRNSRRKNLDLEMLEQLEAKNKSSKKGIFNSLIKMNSNKGKRVAD